MAQANIKVVKWKNDRAPDEPALRKILDAEGLHPYRWSNGPGDIYGAHSHTFDKVIYVVRGSIVFGLSDTGEQVVLFPGDRLDLPAGVMHNAVVGENGVVCLEAHR